MSEGTIELRAALATSYHAVLRGGEIGLLTWKALFGIIAMGVYVSKWESSLVSVDFCP